MSDVDALNAAWEQSALDDRISHEREDAERKAHIRELRNLLSAERIKADMLRTIAEHAPLLTPPTLHGYDGPSSRPRHTWVLCLSDLQHGQKTTLEASGHVFEQSSAISREQFRMLWDRLDALARIASQSIEIDELVILDLGDLHEGDSMRVSQAMKVDAPVTVQCVEVTDLLSELIHNALARFPKVRYRGRPCQLLLDFHNDHGWVATRPIYLETTSMVRPSDFWQTVAEREGAA